MINTMIFSNVSDHSCLLGFYDKENPKKTFVVVTFLRNQFQLNLMKTSNI